MKLKYEMQIIDLDGSPMAVPLEGGEAFRGVLHMNGTTAEILKLLENDVTEDDIVSALLIKYNASEERIRAGVKKTLSTLRVNDLISE